MLSMPALLRLLVHRSRQNSNEPTSATSRPSLTFPVRDGRRTLERKRTQRASMPPPVRVREESPAPSSDKTSTSHYVLRRNTVQFPDLPALKHHASLQALNVHLTSTLALPPPPPPRVKRASTMAMARPPKRKPVPSLFALDPENAPLMIPLPPSPVTEAEESSEDEVEAMVL